MEPTSTQAVKADTTTQEPVVKRLRRGDVREDGMVFLAYASGCVDGKYWTTPEEFAATKAAEKVRQAKKQTDLYIKKATLPTKLRRGDLREDGMVFWAYAASCLNGEQWFTPDEFAAKKATEKAANKAKNAKRKVNLSTKKAALLTKLRRGDTREDGKIFWEYGPSYEDSEWWMTSEQFAAKKAKRNTRARERRATDPLYALKCRLRCRVYSALKNKGFKKNTKTALMLGCTYEDFKAYIESKFLPGMAWDTFLSDCHIDHLVPLDVADTEEDVYSLSHYTNLRPLWGPDNLAKNAKLPEEHELPDNLHPKVKEIWLTAQAR